jgi:hypothetical protein
MDVVESAIGALFCFVHLSSELSEDTIAVLRQKQVNIPTDTFGNWITIGLNTSSGHDSTSPDAVSHMIFAYGETFFVYREDWSTYIWSNMEQTWVPSDIAIVSAYVPNMPVGEISDNIIPLFNIINTPTATLPSDQERPSKRRKRFFKTTEEHEICRRLFV